MKQANKSCYPLFCKISTIFIIAAASLLFLIIDRTQPKVSGINMYTIENTTEKCLIIVDDMNGRLGNRLFMFSVGLGLALTHSCVLNLAAAYIPELRKTFLIDLPKNLVQSQRYYPDSPKKIDNHCTYIPDLIAPNKTQILEIGGFWQVHKYFSHHASAIRQQLRFRPKILDRVHAFFITHIPERIKTRVGIHIRQGDIVGSRPTSSPQYIFDSMEYFKKKYNSTIFIVASDDRHYCIQLFGNMSDVILTPNYFNGPMDLATLASCDHVITTVGTFGWWAGFLLRNSTGEVLIDTKSDGAPIDVNCEGDAYFPPWFLSLKKNVTRTV